VTAESDGRKATAAIFGAACAVGVELDHLFESDEAIGSVLAIDDAPQPAAKSAGAKLKYQSIPTTDEKRVQEAFKAAGVQFATYLAPFAAASTNDARKIDDTAGLKVFLSACEAAGVEAVAVTTGATIYGARKENPQYFAEGAPLRPDGLAPAEADLAREKLCADFARRNPLIALVVCRLAQVVGPGTKGFFTSLVESPKLMLVEGYDPAVQFVHAEDVARAVHKLLRTQKTGVYNIAPDDYTTFMQVGRAFKKPLVRSSLRMTRFKSWLGGLFGGLSPDLLPLLQFPILLTNRKIKRDLAYSFKYGSEQALAHHAKAAPRAAS
jgi:UDP-glucose 4-epimerase